VKEDTERLLVAQLSQILLDRGWRLACAESCTGGWISKCCTDLAGSSAWFDRGYVTYSDGAKRDMLDVQPAVLQRHGAVSEVVARQMAQNALRMSRVEVALAVTGIAGPDGGSAQKPVGTVWFAWAIQDLDTSSERICFTGDRESIRRQTVRHALQGLLSRLAVG